MALLTMFTAIILLLLLLTPFSPVLKADDKLIQIECHNAEVPSTCIQCLQSNQRSQKADRVGIATIIVSCLKNHAQSLAASMSHLASGAKDKEMKNRFEECSQGFSPAMKELSSATIRLKKAKYDDAERSVNKALYCYNLSCQSIIQSYKHTPKHVVYSIRIYEELSEAANRVIERL